MFIQYVDSITMDAKSTSNNEEFENQIDQLVIALNNRPPSRLPSDTQVPRMEAEKEYKVVELRSGKHRVRKKKEANA